MGLEPTTNGLTYLIGFHRPPGPARGRAGPSVESLDYPIAIAGVPRLVSEAGAGDPPVPCLLITQSPAFSNRHACRYQRRCGVGGSQGVPAYCGIHSSRFGFFPREAPETTLRRCLKSVALPTELPGQKLALLDYAPGSPASSPPRVGPGPFHSLWEGEAPAEPALTWDEWPRSAGASPSQFRSTIKHETALRVGRSPSAWMGAPTLSGGVGSRPCLPAPRCPEK